MTENEAKEFLIGISYKLGNMAIEYLTEKDGEKMREAIKALEQEPCGDAISRQAVDTLVDELARAISDERCCISRGRSTATIMQDILDLPPVNSQEPKTGHWYIDERPESDRKVICSNFEQPIFKYHKMDFDYRPKHCPNCGAKMVEPQERSGEE